MQIILDETWKEVLDLLRRYEIPEATLERKGDTLTLEEMNESHVVLVRAELQGSVAGDSELDRLGVNVEKLFQILKVYGVPRRAEVREEDSEIHFPSAPSNDGSDLPVDEAEDTLSVKEPSQEESPDLNIEVDVEAEGVELGFPLYASRKIHGVEGYQATITVEDGKLLLEYWTEDSVDGHRSVLGKAKGDSVSSTYHPELLEPLRGKWNLQLGPDLPLKAERVIDEGKEDLKADVTVIVAPKVKNVG